MRAGSGVPEWVAFGLGRGSGAEGPGCELAMWDLGRWCQDFGSEFEVWSFGFGVLRLESQV